MVCKLIDAQPKAAIVYNEVSTIYEAVRFHRLEEGDIVGRVSWTEMQVTEAIGSPRLLRLRHQRPCSRDTSEQRHEVATPHSIT
jgi:hypothetical protein